MPHFQQSPESGFSPQETHARPHDAVDPAFQCAVSDGARDSAWISIRGELDLAAAPAVRRALVDSQDRASLVVLDLRDLTFMDASGLHLIADADARARRGRQRLVLVRGSAQIDRLFELVGLAGRLEIVEVATARNACPPPTAPPAA